jgi:SAM-dependent methyltransferase
MSPATVRYCNICGSNHFVAGPNGRKASTGILPECGRCHSLERHRAIRSALAVLPPALLAEARALHFSPDGMLDPLAFRAYEPSIFRGPNHIDLNQIERADGAYDLIALSHVLEYMDNDRAVMEELSRVTSTRGALLICFARPLLDGGTIDYAEPQPPNGHYRIYGDDVFTRFRESGISSALNVTSTDAVTEVAIEFFLFFRDPGRAGEFRLGFDRGKVAVVPAA